jgi:phytoene dehydrogenase-like protein
MSGLAAGIRLAHYGKKVCICERHFRTGGLNSYFDRGTFKLETGLHAMTNFARRKDPKSLPLLKLLRQLRIPYDSLMLREQHYSQIAFPGNTLKFSNDFSMLEASVLESFPKEIDNFLKLDELITGFDELDMNRGYVSARETVKNYLKEPLLTEMLFCPLMYYGSAVEDDMDFAQFAIMYKSILRQGFCRPAGEGVRELLKLLEKRFTESGGELKLNCGIASLNSKSGRLSSVTTDKGEVLEAEKVLSSAGVLETMKLCQPEPDDLPDIPAGQLGYLETIAVMGDYLDKFDHQETITFFCNSEEFAYRKPDNAFSLDSGVICFPHNFQFEPNDQKPDKAVRITVLANHEFWKRDEKNYQEQKKAATSAILKETEKLTGITDIENRAILIDTMTPATIERYTGHLNGAIYGSPHKVKDGSTCLENLYLCGTDQGFLGITGAMLSGISIANMYLLT